jgi:uncharacterized protein
MAMQFRSHRWPIDNRLSLPLFLMALRATKSDENAADHKERWSAPRQACYKGSLKIVVRNQTRNTILADAAEVADTSEKRRTGLLKHNRLEPGQGLRIIPCESVHSFFMKFVIDLVYLDRNKKVRKVRHRMVPWRLSACLSAHSILELPAGVVEATGTQEGDQLEMEQQETGDRRQETE